MESPNNSNEETNFKTYDESFWKIIRWLILYFILILSLPLLFTKCSSKLFFFNSTDQIGDTIGGILSPFIAIAAAVITFLAFWIQYKANQQQFKAYEQQKRDIQDTKKENVIVKIINVIYKQLEIISQTMHKIELYDIVSFNTTGQQQYGLKGIEGIIELNNSLNQFSQLKNSFDYSNFLCLNKGQLKEVLFIIKNTTIILQRLCNNPIFTDNDKNEIYQIFCMNIGEEVRMITLNLITVTTELLNQQNPKYQIDNSKLEELRRAACNTYKELKKIDSLHPLYPALDLDYNCQD